MHPSNPKKATCWVNSSLLCPAGKDICRLQAVHTHTLHRKHRCGDGLLRASHRWSPLEVNKPEESSWDEYLIVVVGCHPSETTQMSWRKHLQGSKTPPLSLRGHAYGFTTRRAPTSQWSAMCPACVLPHNSTPGTVRCHVLGLGPWTRWLRMDTMHYGALWQSPSPPHPPPPPHIMHVRSVPSWGLKAAPRNIHKSKTTPRE